MADKEKEKSKIDLGLLEEDDEFEEFPVEEDWVEAEGGDDEEALTVWEDNWDDDNLDNLDDFNQQLKQQLQKGFLRAEWHADIYEEVSRSLRTLGLETECLGGGRIDHKPSEKKIKVYGYSQGYGKADHEEAKKILLTKYKNYEIECSDEGY